MILRLSHLANAWHVLHTRFHFIRIYILIILILHLFSLALFLHQLSIRTSWSHSEVFVEWHNYRKKVWWKKEMSLLTLSALWILSSVLGWIWSLHLLLFFSCQQISFLYRLWTSRSLWHFAGDVSCWCLALLFEGASWFVCSGIHLIHQFNGCTSGSYWSTLLESLMSFNTIRWGSSSILFSESDLMFGLWLSWNITTHGHGLDLAGHRAIIILVSTTWCLLLAGTLWVLRTYLAWICLTILLFHIH